MQDRAHNKELSAQNVDSDEDEKPWKEDKSPMVYMKGGVWHS